MKKLVFLSLFIFLISSCSDSTGESKTSAPDERYQIDKVSFLLPKEFVKVEDRAALLKKMEADIPKLNPASKLLWEDFLQSKSQTVLYFINFAAPQFEYISLNAQHPLTLLNDETTDYLLRQYESSVTEKFPEPSLKMKRLQSKLGGANSVRYFKYKYDFSQKDLEWFATNYLIYSNSRTILLSIKSTHSTYQDLENYMQFIQIEK